jgi:hypothetical protein
MRFGLVSRNSLILILLFALAFGGVLFYVNASSHAQDPGPYAGQHGGAQPAALAQDIEPPHGGSPATGPTEPEPPASADSQAEPAPAPPLTDKQAQDLQRWSNEAVSAHVPEARGNAIRELAAMKTRESIQALAYALSSDEEAENRLLAVASLNALARDGYEVGPIRDTLRLAAADADENVADHAKEAYDELMRRDETQ